MRSRKTKQKEKLSKIEKVNLLIAILNLIKIIRELF